MNILSRYIDWRYRNISDNWFAGEGFSKLIPLIPFAILIPVFAYFDPSQNTVDNVLLVFCIPVAAFFLIEFWQIFRIGREKFRAARTARVGKIND